MNKLQIIQKPELQLISETKKLRAYSEVERLTLAKNIVVSLLNKLGVGNKSNEQHHIEVIKFIANNKIFTPEEFEKAFNLAIEGLLAIDLFQQLNCIIVGKVMDEYRNYRKTNLKNYKHQLQLQQSTIKEITESEKKELFINTLKDEFQNFKETEKVNDMRNWLYDKLVDNGLKVSDSAKKVIWKLSVEEINEIQGNLRKRDKYTPDVLKRKAIIIYKSKLIAQIFKQFTTEEQLFKKIELWKKQN